MVPNREVGEDSSEILPRTGGRSRDDIVLDAAEQRLFEALRRQRAEIAREEKCAAYIVFSDRTLAEIAKRRPRSSAALMDVRGVGQHKIDRYGEKFLAVIRRAEEPDAA
jgi:ATP-dependent DNA helicase RecQ